MAPSAAARSLAFVFLSAALLTGCDASDDASTNASHAPEAIADQEDAVCGMLVREQSAPRAQVVHRDGSRFFFCSLGDLLIHTSAPSSHGRVEALFVEVMAPYEDPRESHTGSHTWNAAQDAVYVVGIDRPGVMGDPVLSYASAHDARRAVQSHPEAQILNFAELKQWWRQAQAAR